MRGLAFSGGKDSWACLLLEEDLSTLPVIWVNTGKNYPEALESIETARALCGNFVEVVVDRDLQNEYKGLPSDIVPISWTLEGQACTKQRSVKVQSYMMCCYENIAAPMYQKAQELGITELVMGQRNQEKYKSTSRNGDIVFGIKRLHPIEHWSDKQVFDFLSERMDVPAHFTINHSSLDCFDCTAYRKESKDRVEFTRVTHPLLYQHYYQRDFELKRAIEESLGESYGD